MEVRSATVEDLAAIEKLLSSVDLPRAGLLDQFPKGYAVAMREGQLMGCAGLEVYGRVGLLRSVAVVPIGRGVGIGRALVADRLATAIAAKLDAVYLLTTMADNFFADLGFTRVARTAAPAALAASPEFASACPASASCLVFEIERSASQQQSA